MMINQSSFRDASLENVFGFTTFRTFLFISIISFYLAGCSAATPKETSTGNFDELEHNFRTLPMEARRLTGPLFWLHGTESEEKLRHYIKKIAESGNGSFTPESRPHRDWLGPGWYRDLAISLDAARTNNLHMWIFDEKWWPSGEVGGNVPRKYSARYLELNKTSLETGQLQKEVPDEQLVAVLAGKQNQQGIVGDSLVDLTNRVSSGRLSWTVPEGNWTLLTYTWTPGTNFRDNYQVDGLRPEAVRWYMQKVYQPHYNRFSDAHGNTIRGYFYDEPATPGDWGPALRSELNRRGLDWKDAIVAWTDQLADSERQFALTYQYQDAKAEAWGRTLFGRIAEWSRNRDVRSIGHFIEQQFKYLGMEYAAGNMFQLQKHSAMGGIDLVVNQMYPGERPEDIYQTPKLASSISHVYDKRKDIAMVEIFGGYEQNLTYPQMKWLTDHMQVRGVNYMVTHAFNPKSPYDTDFPPYFYNSGYEPRFPLYRVWANYTNRLSNLLTGGRHVCPVAFLFVGNSYHAGDAETPERMTSALQDALFDSDWIPYDVFEENMSIDQQQLSLYEEQYRVLVVPSAEVIPHETMKKAVRFYRNGGVVIGYGRLPNQSATPGKSSADIAQLRATIWGENPSQGTSVQQTNSAGGRSYFLPGEPTSGQIHDILVEDADIHPTMEVLRGNTNDWLHVLHRRKMNHDLFFITNQNTDGGRKTFRLKFHADGTPEIWDAMRGTIRSVSHERVRDGVTKLTLHLEPMESTVVVFNRTKRDLPSRITENTPEIHDSIPVKQQESEAKEERPEPEPNTDDSLSTSSISLEDCSWVWHPDELEDAPGGSTRYFRKEVQLPKDRTIKSATFRISADNSVRLYVNGRRMYGNEDAMTNWQRSRSLDMSQHLQPGTNVFAIPAQNHGSEPNPAGLIGRYQITFENGDTMSQCINTQWKTSKTSEKGWKTAGANVSNWVQAGEIASYGDDPWGSISNTSDITRSPVEANPFAGTCRIPKDVNLDEVRAVLTMQGVKPEEAARVFVNHESAGGVIGQPLRMDITSDLKPGKNHIRIVPFAPSRTQVKFYPSE